MVLFLVLLITQIASAHWYNPVADPKSVFQFGNARFTMLTPSLIRIEFSRSSSWQDRSTISILNRKVPIFPWTTTKSGSAVLLQTSHLDVHYDPNQDLSDAFSPKSLQISPKDRSWTWTPGTPDTGNLHGTIRTLEGPHSAGRHELDCKRNKVEYDFCTEGLHSKNGWVLVDDSNSPLLDGTWWDWVLPRTSNQTDWYFFGYGTRFREAMKDFTTLAGKIPLPPRYAFGSFWSRYWAYSDIGEKQIVQEYQNHNTPLDVMVIDMDWHITFYKEAAQGKTDQAGQRVGWTGYTWDDGLFPDPKGFLDWVRNKGLRVTLNLHPASGVQPHELRYPEMARAMGIDPSTKKYVPFQIESKKYATNLFDIMLDPLTQQGVDFWWLDWQQFENTSIPNLNPTFWLNHVFFTRFEQFQDQRPVILHRWGGLGNHRYQLGFSGDVTPTWEALNFQPYFTATAANVGFMWSHDIGGHTKPVGAEMYTRWIQFGIWSPVFRTHCTKNPDNDRRIWTYPFEYFKIMRDEIETRSRMIPYIYTSARVAHDTGVAVVYPIYYDYPQQEAYDATLKNQYMFGDSIMAAPVTQPIDNSTQLADRALWIPPGTWIEKDSLKVFTGPFHTSRSYTIDETPIFFKAGSIIPMKPRGRSLLGSAEELYTAIHYSVYPFGDNSDGQSTYRLYQDAGNDQEYLHGRSAWFNSVFNQTNNTLSFVTYSPAGGFPGMPSTWDYSVEFHGVYLPKSVSVDGRTLPYLGQTGFSDNRDGYTYSPSDLSLTVQLFSATGSKSILVEKGSAPLSLQNIRRCFRRLTNVVNGLDANFPHIFQEDYKAVLQANEVQSTVDNFVQKLPTFLPLLQQSITQIKALDLDDAVKKPLLNALLCF